MSPRFDWNSPTLCPAKIRAVIDRLAEGGHASVRERLRDCIRGIRPHVGHLYGKNLNVIFNKIRCSLKLRCAWCMRPQNVLVRRGQDFERLKMAAQWVGATEKSCRVWLVEWPDDGRPGWGERISRILSDGHSRRHAALDSIWGGEMAARGIGAKMVYLGPLPTRTLLLFAAPQASLDYQRLRKAIPSVVIHTFHGALLTGWQKYLLGWAEAQWEASAQATVDWMVSRQHTFTPLGRLRSTRERIEERESTKRDRTHGDCQLITYGTRRQSIAQVEAATERHLPENYERLMHRPIDFEDHARIMSQVKPELEARFPVVPEPEDELPLTPLQIARNEESLAELQREMLAEDIVQRVVEKLERRQQLRDLAELDYRKSKPLVQ